MRIDFRVPILPNRHFFSNIRLAALSLRRLGAPYADAAIQVYVGDDPDLDWVLAQNRWSTDFPIEWRIVPPNVSLKRPYVGTANERFASPSSADVVICCDADTCFVDRIDDLLARLKAEEPIAAGTQAHFPPWQSRDRENDKEWSRVFVRADVPIPPLTSHYSIDLKGDMGHTPSYFNFGFVAFNAAGFAAVALHVENFSKCVEPILIFPRFQCQIGLTLACAREKVRTLELSHAYNCANDDRVPSDLLANPALVRVVHYLRRNEFDRATFLADKDAFLEFVGVPKKNAISERLRQHVIDLGNAFLPDAE